MIKSLTTALFCTALVATSAFAATNGSDNASNYGGSWTDGSNQGTGFQPWNLTGNNNNPGGGVFGGYFLGDSTQGAGDINTGGAAFAVFANPGSAFANADRNFDSPLLTDQTFSLQISVNFRNGNKGFNLYDGGTQLFNFNVGNDMYQINGADTGLGYDAAAIFNLAFTQTTGSGGTYTVSRGVDSFTGNYTGVASGFRVYNSGTDSGDNANNIYFNNLSITTAPVPEPSTLTLLAGPALLGGWFFLRRRRVS